MASTALNYATHLALIGEDGAVRLGEELAAINEGRQRMRRIVIGDGTPQHFLLEQPLTISANDVEIVGDGVMFTCKGNPALILTGHSIIVRGLHLNGGHVPDANIGQHGIINKGRNIIERCIIENFRGNGIHTEADVNAGTNANGSIYRQNKIGQVWNGMYMVGGDANHIITADNFFGDCTQWSIWDNSFLGCIHTNEHSENGAINLHNRTLVSHNGVRYAALLPEVTGIEPGIHPAWKSFWIARGEGGVNAYWKAWSEKEPYIFGGDYAATNANNTAVFTNCYNEDAAASPNIAWGHAQFVGGRAAKKVVGASIHAEQGMVKVSHLRVGGTGPGEYAAGIAPGTGYGAGFYQYTPGTGQVQRWAYEPGLKLTGWNWADLGSGWWIFNVNRNTPNKTLFRGEGTLGFETDWRQTPELHRVQDARKTVKVGYYTKPPEDESWKPGDRIINPDAGEGQPMEWRMTDKGWLALYAWEAPKKYKSHAAADADKALRPGAHYYLMNTRGVYRKP